MSGAAETPGAQETPTVHTYTTSRDVPRHSTQFGADRAHTVRSCTGCKIEEHHRAGQPARWFRMAEPGSGDTTFLDYDVEPECRAVTRTNLIAAALAAHAPVAMTDAQIAARAPGADSIQPRNVVLAFQAMAGHSPSSREGLAQAIIAHPERFAQCSASAIEIALS